MLPGNGPYQVETAMTLTTRLGSLVLAAAVVFGAAERASALSLPVTGFNEPDLSSGFVGFLGGGGTVTYDILPSGTEGRFQFTSNVLGDGFFEFGGFDYNVVEQTLQIDVTVDISTGLVVSNNLPGGGGFLVLGDAGTVPGVSPGVQPLFTANLIAVGDDGPAEFLWDLDAVADGALESYYTGNAGQSNDLALTIFNNSLSGFGFTNFATELNGGLPVNGLTADFDTQGVFLVPVPGALPLMLTGLAAFGYLGYRRRRAAAAA